MKTQGTMESVGNATHTIITTTNISISSGAEDLLPALMLELCKHQYLFNVFFINSINRQCDLQKRKIWPLDLLIVAYSFSIGSKQIVIGEHICITSNYSIV